MNNFDPDGQSASTQPLSLMLIGGLLIHDELPLIDVLELGERSGLNIAAQGRAIQDLSHQNLASVLNGSGGPKLVATRKLSQLPCPRRLRALAAFQLCGSAVRHA